MVSGILLERAAPGAQGEYEGLETKQPDALAPVSLPGASDAAESALIETEGECEGLETKQPDEKRE